MRPLQHLLGDAQGALHAAGRLRLDGQVGGATPATYRATPPMEQRHLHPRLPAHLQAPPDILSPPFATATSVSGQLMRSGGPSPSSGMGTGLGLRACSGALPRVEWPQHGVYCCGRRYEAC